jgi:7-carboxy-7-deazaguanine synthase
MLLFLQSLCDAGYSVSLETGGALDIAPVDKRVSVILDIKTPASNEEKNMRWENIAHIKRGMKSNLCCVIVLTTIGQSENDSDLKLTDKCPILIFT